MKVIRKLLSFNNNLLSANYYSISSFFHILSLNFNLSFFVVNNCSNLRSSLNHVELATGEGTFDILRIPVIDLLDVGANGTDLVHEVLSEGLIQDQLLLVVADAEFLLLVHGVAVKETCTGKT